MMEIKTGTEQKAEVLIELVFSDGGYAPELPVSAKMKERGAQAWFYGRSPGEQDILIIGLGARNRFSMEILREAAGNAGRAIQDIGKKTAAVNPSCLHELFGSTLWPQEAVTAWVEGWQLGTYLFIKYKSVEKQPPVEWIQLSPDQQQDYATAAELGQIRAEATSLARDLCNEAASDLNPAAFVSRIQHIFAGRDVKIHVYEGEELKQRQMNGLQAVGAGSKYPPAMVEISYTSDPDAEHLALIGKGVTFDMGGMNLKDARDLSDARFDMGGAAAIIGAMDVLTRLKVRARISAIIPIVDNVPDGGAFLPSDVVRYPNGLTVQVVNTDAEGRLILADAILHAIRSGATQVIDVATLTGAVGHALGLKVAGVWGDAEYAEQLMQIGERNGDRIWRLPLVDEDEELLNSPYADLANLASNPYGGANMAALFLRRFVDSKARWCHIDMANTAQVPSTRGYKVLGATGYGVRLLADFVCEQISASERGGNS
ncbi:leucyl aminopeptidase family protein [Paenibacillus dokdonensis]|uniref:Probable cytosol aminopeptidase n=2 Tax=Paenibacillus dokdonensis TaxID=2567944 RepID=A0ABU6GKG4_9BACL|nr:leucyl aminopeptidase family protein [Paenibacillus dokdonensis]MEC0238721.1 leucyl aminopeptidase family protein [Paenibacillus dokdonensis]